MQDVIYKICPTELWEQANKQGSFEGAPIDLQDGFIHFSNAQQVAETAAKHFGGQSDLLLLTIPTAALGEGLKWEPSRGSDLFPHLYGPLALDAVTRVDPLPLDDAGVHLLPGHVVTV